MYQLCTAHFVPAGGKLVFRFEPFLLHAECVDMVAAGWLLHGAVLAGFRESGATLGANANRIIVSFLPCHLMCTMQP